MKTIGITSENPDGAKRTRTADPLHAMQHQKPLQIQVITGFMTVF